jgi:hypothetical protein
MLRQMASTQRRTWDITASQVPRIPGGWGRRYSDTAHPLQHLHTPNRNPYIRKEHARSLHLTNLPCFMPCSLRYAPPIARLTQSIISICFQSRFPTTAMREEVGRSIGLSARKVQASFNLLILPRLTDLSIASTSGLVPGEYPFWFFCGKQNLPDTNSQNERQKARQQRDSQNQGSPASSTVNPPDERATSSEHDRSPQTHEGGLFEPSAWSDHRSESSLLSG